MSSTDLKSEQKPINSLDNNETSKITILTPLPPQDSYSNSTTATQFKKTQIHVTENQVHDAAHHYQMQEDSLFLNKSSQNYQSKRSNILKIDHTGWHRFLPRCLRFAFADHEFEQLYREYYENEKRTDFKTLILIIFIVNLSFLSVRLLSLDKQDKQLMVTLSVIAISLVIIYILINRRLMDNQRKLSLRLSKSTKKDNALNQRTDCQQIVHGCLDLFTYDNLIWLMMPYLIWLLILFEIFVDLIYFRTEKFSLCDALSSLLLFTYAIYVVFPLRLRIASILAILTAVFYLSLSLCRQRLIVNNNDLKWRLVFADLFLIICVNLVGLMSYFFYEKRQRRAFLETCICLENKLDEEEESQEQERLLLSVLPKHVVNNIREDLGNVIDKPFKRIYMRRHEEVSILFADIVGFTAISSTLPAPQLVKILNELFARFDKLSDKYHQLRIKILGDCYYCISGAPTKRPDHAVLCVHMGLSMVEVIKSVREQTKFNVDMRVGIHTGGVLAGVLGQKQWQFDVYSKDVELANRMESGGLPGRVHISEDTVKFLNGEFELEDGAGYTREETIRSYGIKTYLIVKVLKPYPEGTLDEKQINQTENNIEQSTANEQQKLLQDINSQTATNDTNNNTNSNNEVQRKVSNAIARTSITGHHTSTVVEPAFSTTTSRSSINQTSQNMDEYQRRLRYELLNRDNVQMKEQIRPFTFSFSDEDYEHQYMNNSDETAGVSLTGLPITALLTTFAELTLGVSSFLSFIVLITSSIVQSFLALLSTVTSWAGRRYSYTNESSFEKDSLDLEAFNQRLPSNEQISMQEMKLAGNERSPLKANGDHSGLNNNNKLTAFNASPNKSNRQLSRHSSASRKSIFNKYRLSEERVLISNCLPKPLLSISLAVQHNAIARLIIYLIMILIWLSTSVIINLDYYNQITKHSIDTNETTNEQPVHNTASIDWENNDEQNESTIKSLYLTYYIVLLLLAISALKRISLLLKMSIIFGCTILQSVLNFVFHKRIIKRLDKNWYRIDLDVDGHLIYLTTQLLGITVACFILNRQFELMSRRLFLWQKEVEEQKKKVKMMKNKNEKLLYNILPLHVATHFLGRRKRDEELYSKSYNSVGVLFAAVPNFTDFYTEESVNNQGLECLRFLNEVISDFDGLLDQDRFRNISKIKTISSTYMAASGLNIEIEDEDTDLKTRWSHLADLTHFALALKETLDNINSESFNNFVLKIGINHGPITAGVIGARKPHYDIWGNTVNVASRMESTGKAGCIQVTEETSKILQLFNFQFEPRGQVAVKGKGKLMTYYLVNNTK